MNAHIIFVANDIVCVQKVTERDRKSRSLNVRCFGFWNVFIIFDPWISHVLFVLWIIEFAHQISDKGQNFTFNPYGNLKMNKNMEKFARIGGPKSFDSIRLNCIHCGKGHPLDFPFIAFDNSSLLLK